MKFVAYCVNGMSQNLSLIASPNNIDNQFLYLVFVERSKMEKKMTKMTRVLDTNEHIHTSDMNCNICLA